MGFSSMPDKNHEEMREKAVRAIRSEDKKILDGLIQEAFDLTEIPDPLGFILLAYRNMFCLDLGPVTTGNAQNLFKKAEALVQKGDHPDRKYVLCLEAYVHFHHFKPRSVEHTQRKLDQLYGNDPYVQHVISATREKRGEQV